MVRPAKRAKLLSDVSSDSEEGSSAGTNQFKVNEGFASRFEHNKKREELQRLEEKYSHLPSHDAHKMDHVDAQDEDEDSEEDESEDDDGELVTEDVDQEITATLHAIKSKDPRVYDSSVKFYRDFETDEVRKVEGKAEQPMYLQDYHRRNLLSGRNGEDVEERPAPQSYQEEQDTMRKELVTSMHANAKLGDDGDEEELGDFLKPKPKSIHESMPTAKSRKITEKEVAAADEDPETYLSNFMTAKAWLPRGSSGWQALESDDSEEDERAEKFEEAYNLRFEDPQLANEKLQSFGRDVGKYGVRRDEKTGRKRTREREREQRDQLKKEREDERTRLRKLRIEDAEAKVKRIKDAAGLYGHEVDIDQWRDVIEGDFDDDQWESKMKQRFGEDYYTAGDSVKKPTWDDDIDIKDLVPDFEVAPQAPISLSDVESDDPSTGEAAAGYEQPEVNNYGINPARDAPKIRTKSKAEAKRVARKERRALESMVDSTLPLSHPDLAPSLPAPKKGIKQSTSGFRYRDTSPTSFGLTASDILFADDSQLNQYAGLKKMAAFRDPEKKRRDKKRLSKKARLREWRKEVFGSVDGPQHQHADQTAEPIPRGRILDDQGGNASQGAKKRKRKSKTSKNV